MDGGTHPESRAPPEKAKGKSNEKQTLIKDNLTKPESKVWGHK